MPQKNRTKIFQNNLNIIIFTQASICKGKNKLLISIAKSKTVMTWLKTFKSFKYNLISKYESGAVELTNINFELLKIATVKDDSTPGMEFCVYIV